VKLVAVFLALIPLAFGGMDKVWELRVGDRIKEPSGWPEDTNHPVTALAFSPDGKKLAVAIDYHFPTTGGGTHVMVVDLATPSDATHQFDVRSCGEFMEWSVNGGALLVCGEVLRLRDGTSCDAAGPFRPSIALVNSVFWLDSSRVVRSSLVRWSESVGYADMKILDANCNEVGAWTTNGKWGIVDTASSKGLALLSRTVGQRPNISQEHAVAVIASQEMASWRPISDTGKAVFASGADAVCSFDWRNGNGRLGCWDFNSGKRLALSRGIGKYQIVEASTAAPRAIAEHWAYPSFFTCLGLCQAELRLRAVYDFRSKMVLASWKPAVQHWRSEGGREEPERCAISPDGQFVAEGGDGVVRLYRLTP
jgi:WD40 repeat protein